MRFAPLAFVGLLALLEPGARAWAHMVSISTGEARLEGAKLHYELRVPLYEVAHLRQPERELLPLVEFPGARRIGGSCRPLPEQAALFCEAEFEYSQPPETLRVRSGLHRVTIANHVHLLHAERNGVTDQAVLEFSFPEAEIRFLPFDATDAAFQQFSAGVTRAAAGAPQLLFLFALVVAARRRMELLALTGAFVAGQALASAASQWTGWLPTPRFLEAAAALAVAYLAVEILFLPEARHRWAVVGALGAIHGLAVASLVNVSDFSLLWVLSGAAITETAVIAVVGLAWWLLPVRPARIAAAALLAIGLGWFGWRMWN
jgi:hypothetical protein